LALGTLGNYGTFRCQMKMPTICFAQRVACGYQAGAKPPLCRWYCYK